MHLEAYKPGAGTVGGPGGLMAAGSPHRCLAEAQFCCGQESPLKRQQAAVGVNRVAFARWRGCEQTFGPRLAPGASRTGREP